MLNSLFPYRLSRSGISLELRGFGFKNVLMGGFLVEGYDRRANVRGSRDATE